MNTSLLQGNLSIVEALLKGASENRRLFDRKKRLLELDDFGDSNANWNANGRKKCAVSET